MGKAKRPINVRSIKWFSYDYFVLFLFALIVGGYIFFLKSSHKQPVYIRASIQVPQWWQSPAQIPALLLASLKNGDTDVSGNLKIVELKYFVSQQANWEVNSTDRYIGRIQFLINATKQNGKLYYNGQELFIGNPLIAEIGNTRLELLITDIGNKMIGDEMTKQKLLVRIYNKYPEQIEPIQNGMALKDNDGLIYANVIKVTPELSRITTTDQNGNTHMERDPWKYDLNVEVETLAKRINSRIVGYDGRTIALGKMFIFNSPDLDDVGGYIIKIF